MQLKKSFFWFILFLFCVVNLHAQNLNGAISSSVYAFERAESFTDSEMFLRGYETLILNINQGNYSLRTRLNFETNFSKQLDSDPRLRFYNLYFEARKIADIATIKLGRQPIFNQMAGGLFDGANIKLDVNNFIVQGYFGGNVPAYQKLEITDNFKTDRIWGGKLAYNGLANTSFALSYVDKNFKSIDYEAQRLDVNLSPITVLIQQKSNQFRYGSASVSYFGLVNVDARVNYDFNFDKLSKAEFIGRYDKVENFGFSLYYNYRAPQIRYNSIFAVFDFANTQEIEGGVDYKFDQNFTFFGKFGNVTFKDDNSQRFSLGVNSNYGSLSYRQTLGYSGELSTISLYSAHSFLTGFLTPSVGIAYTSYKLNEDSEKNNIISLLAGLNVRPFKVLSFDLQGQYFDNKIYKNDVRLFFKINYWFNTNLDLL